MMEFTFDQSAWELSLAALKSGADLSAAAFLTMMESEPEEDFEEALQYLADRDILLDVSDLPGDSGSGETALRLRLEQQLARQNRLPEGLEESDPLRLYLQELASIPVCGDPELLAQKAASGDESAQTMLMNRMLSRVLQHAMGYAGHSVLLMDLIQEGSMAAWQAVLTPAQSNFENYCDRCIRSAIAQALVQQARQNGVGQKLRQRMEDYRAVDEELLSQLGRNPTLEEIAQQMHVAPQEAELISQMITAARTVSRAKAQTQEKEPTPDDQMAVEDTSYFQMRQRIADLLSSLDEADAQLITLRYGLEGGLPLTPEETGRKLGLTAEEVVAREAAALSKLRSQ